MASLLDEYSNIHQLVRVGRFQNEISGKMCCANVFSFEKAEFSLLNCYTYRTISVIVLFVIGKKAKLK